MNLNASVICFQQSVSNVLAKRNTFRLLHMNVLGWFLRFVCFLPPCAVFVRWPVVGVRFFLPLAFQGLPGFGPGGCVCV